MVMMIAATNLMNQTNYVWVLFVLKVRFAAVMERVLQSLQHVIIRWIAEMEVMNWS